MRVHSSKVLLAAMAAVAALVTIAGEAAAMTIISSPFGNDPVDVIIGSQTNSSGEVQQVIVWKNINTKTCETTVLGDATGLNTDYHVKLSDQDDLLWLSDGAGGWSVGDCHGSGGWLNYAGHYVDVDMLGGNDGVSAGAGDTFIFAGPGDDYIWTFNPTGYVLGGDGNDILKTMSTADSEHLDGGNGNDCLDDSSQAAGSFDCGEGRDGFVGSPSNAINCEIPVDFCQSDHPF